MSVHGAGTYVAEGTAAAAAAAAGVPWWDHLRSQ